MVTMTMMAASTTLNRSPPGRGASPRSSSSSRSSSIIIGAEVIATRASGPRKGGCEGRLVSHPQQSRSAVWIGSMEACVRPRPTSSGGPCPELGRALVETRRGTFYQVPTLGCGFCLHASLSIALLQQAVATMRPGRDTLKSRRNPRLLASPNQAIAYRMNAEKGRW
jgi:hypothetical protein